MAPPEPEESRPGGLAAPETQADHGALFFKLKDLRSRLAREAGVPSYIIFSDASLRDMCRKRPVTPGAFLSVAGVGSRKMEKYGEAFTGLIREHGSGL
jgi:ATP-dependent DNA helicase RecQ